MGRTLRVRVRKKNDDDVTTLNKKYVKYESEYVKLVDWLKQSGNWKPTCKLVAANFQTTGRGLMAKKKITAGSTIAKIPCNLLITVKTVIRSGRLDWLFSGDKVFSTQQVLSTFLVWERHLADQSFWSMYIKCLPTLFTIPVCSSNSSMPSHIREKIASNNDTVERTFAMIQELVAGKCCKHCGKLFDDIISWDLYLWAWCVVNTRAVYMCPHFNGQDSIILSDDNTLALAPYIDMFNHSCHSEVKAYVVKDKNGGMYYQIDTMVSVKKGEQVFINYGPLPNDRLFIDYGFIISGNIQDSVTFTYDDILAVVNARYPENKQINNCRKALLEERKLFDKISCYSDSLSWQLEATIYIFICPVGMTIESMKKNVFSDSFKKLPSVCENIQTIASSMITLKIEQRKRELQELSKMNEEIPCLSAARDLLDEHIKLLNECKKTLISSST